MTRPTPDTAHDNLAMVHGALIAIGTLGIVDTVVVHWILGLHRLVETWSPTTNLIAETAVVLTSAVLVGVGLVRERWRRAVSSSGPRREGDPPAS